MKMQSLVYRLYEKILWRQIKTGPKPQHIGVILDGNRRFAKEKGLDATEGHVFGADKVEELLRWCWRLNIKMITLFAFSTENFNRSQEEVDKLMSLLEKKLKEFQEEPLIEKNRVRIKVIGRREHLSQKLNDEITKVEKLTEDYDNFQLNIAISYGGRAEIVDAVKKIVGKYEKKELAIDDITEEVIGQHLYTEGMPDPDLIIRTSGEERLSGFLLWQSAYSELYFTEIFWPAFRMIDFWRTIRIYQQRERRFGK
ncbi:MAG: di-trans,poly-cis-decaprenylcistransferase [Proteobacteria bacterium]|nr:di-trans,poly-cis-decaprenylcistransferase [Pseudomonadota bacterium]